MTKMLQRKNQRAIPLDTTQGSHTFLKNHFPHFFNTQLKKLNTSLFIFRNS